MSKEVIMKCPDCGTIVKGKYGTFFHRTIECQNCSRKIDPRMDSFEIVECVHCGNTVIRDIKIGSDQSCPVCSASLADYNVSDIDVECPQCHLHSKIKFDEIVHTCAYCDFKFDVNKQKAYANTSSGVASIITVPVDDSAIIWKHAATSFPFASHLVVPEGYTALILRDGICSKPSAPGKYLLSDSIRSMTEQLEYAVLDPDTQISAQIFFVKNNIDLTKFWGLKGEPKRTVSYADGVLAGSLGFGGQISLSVVNAKTFVDYVGYDTATAEELLVDEKDLSSKLYEKVRTICVETMERVLKSAVYNNNFTFEMLDQERPFLKQQGQAEVDNALGEVGLKTSLFTLDFVDFTEDQEKAAARELKEKQEKQLEVVKHQVEALFKWESSPVSIHMSGNQALSAKVTYCGDIKFNISDLEKFKQISEVQYWITNGPEIDSVEKYIRALITSASDRVLGDVLQQTINLNNADVRDLSVLYLSIRSKVEDALVRFFNKYGLFVELFSMREAHRDESIALATLSRSEEHNSVSNIELHAYEEDQDRIVKKATIDGKTTVALDTQSVEVETALTRNEGARSQNTIDKLFIDNNIQDAKDDIERRRKLKKEQQAREDAASKAAWEHEQQLQGYKYQDEISDASHAARMKGYSQVADVSSAEHDANMQSLRQKTDEHQELHYLNQQDIENRAEELRTQWEESDSLKTAQLESAIYMASLKWDEQKKMTQEKAELNNSLARGKAENDRMMHDILQKIAESDLAFEEKKAALARLLKNQEAEDSLRHAVEADEAQIKLKYDARHLENILNKEENDFVEDLCRSEDARAEAAKNADFVRAMQAKEQTYTQELSLLKLEYEQEKYRAEMEQVLQMKDKEIQELRERLSHNAHLSDNEVEKAAIQAEAEKDIKTAEYSYKAAHDAAVYAMEQNKQQQQLDIEEKYMKRLDELISQVLAIDAAVKKYSYDNERESIHANAQVKMTEANANAWSNVAQAEVHTVAMNQTKNMNMTGAQSQFSEMEKMMKQLQRNVRGIKEAIKQMQNAKNAGQPGGNFPPNMNSQMNVNNNYGQHNSTYASNYNTGGDATSQYAGGVTSAYQNSQPGTKVCSHCGAIVPTHSVKCSACGSYL